MTGFLAALRGLPDNPVACREWRSLRHDLRDWRVWLYLRQPRDARGWALRALAWCALLPYALWAALAPLQPWYLRWLGPLRLFDLLLLCFALVGLYLSLMSAAVMAPSIVRERERETWEALRTAAAGPHELLLGLLLGRLLPLLAGFLVLGMVWSYTRPHYAPLLQAYAPVRSSGPQIALLVWELALVAAGAGCLSLAASAWCRQGGTANAVAAADVLLLIGGLLGALLALPRVEGAVILAAGSATAILAGYLSAFYGLQRDAGK
jgi:hypothetical protein